MELTYAAARDLVAAMTAGRLSAVALVRTALSRIEALEPALNALTLVRQAALADAARADDAARDGQPLGPLHGLPVTIKDTFRVAGVRTTYGGLPQYLRHVPAGDCTIVARLRRAGAIILGRSNTPLLALDWQCGNPIFGTTKNPYDTARTPGGSSGGSAAALAAGYTALELGSDLGGSIRYPAHCCGVFGLRPSQGALPTSDTGPENQPDVYPQVVAYGPMARSLSDLRLMWHVLRDSEHKAVAPDRPLRIALTARALGVSIDGETRELLEALVARLRHDGHTVTETAPAGVDFAEAYAVNCLMAGYSLARIMPSLLGRPPGRTMFEAYLFHYKLGDGPFTRGFLAGMRATRSVYERAVARREELRAATDRFFDGFDAWLLPTAPSAAIRRQAYGHPFFVDDQRVPYAVGLGAFTVPTATLATPAVSLPIGIGAHSGMPIGIQLHARHGADDALLAMADAAFSPYCRFQPPALM